MDSFPPGYSVGSLKYGNLDLLVNPIRFSATDTSELQLDLRKAIPTVSVSGRVIDNSPSYPEATFG